MTKEVDEFLAHHGIKGMHWGVIRKVDSSTDRVSGKSIAPAKTNVSADKAKAAAAKAEATQAKRETSAKKYEDKAARFQAIIDKTNNKQYKNAFQEKINAGADRGTIADATKLRDIALSDAQKKRQGKLSSGQKKVLIGAAIVATLITAAVVHENIESGQFRRLAANGKRFVSGNSHSAFTFTRKTSLADKSLSPDDVLKHVVKDINPGYGGIGTKMNCRRATFAYELRRRGYDVAATRTTDGNGQNVAGLFNALSPGEKIRSTSSVKVQAALLKEAASGQSHLSSLKEGFTAGGKKPILMPDAHRLFTALQNEPNGSRGEVGVMWKAGGGHSMAYEIFDGKPVIFDAQSGKKLESVVDFIAHGLNQIEEAGITRLDNVPLNHDYLQKWVKNAAG